MLTINWVEAEVGLLAYPWRPVLLESAKQEVSLADIDTRLPSAIILECQAVYASCVWGTREYQLFAD